MRAAGARATKGKPRAHARFVSALAAALLFGSGRAAASDVADVADAADAAGAPNAGDNRARAAYDRGAAAYDRGDYAAAARAFAEADALAPNAVTLQVALDAAVLADDPVIGAALLERADARPREASLEGSLKAARARFAGKTGRVRVVCPADASPCSAALDGAPISTDKPSFARVGRHEITTVARGQSEARPVEVKPDQETVVTISMSTRANPRSPTGSGLSPVFPLLGVGLTAAALGATIASGLDTRSRHEQFMSAGCAGPAHGDCAGLASGGQASQARTNILLGVTVAMSIPTAALGILFFKTRGDSQAAVALDIRAGGPVAKLALPLP